MERQIKFRGKRIDDGEWVEGNLVMVTDGETLKKHPNIVISYNHDTFDWYDVLPETVGQFTGLKDKKGKEIYEGDIVINEFVQEVVYWHLYDGWCTSSEQTLGESNFAMLKIIGNIHDNSEILK